jgi:hypothetical protein
LNYIFPNFFLSFVSIFLRKLKKYWLPRICNNAVITQRFCKSGSHLIILCARRMTKQESYGGLANVRCQRTTFRRDAEMAPGICAPIQQFIFILQARIMIPCNLVFGCQHYRINKLQVETDQVYSSQAGEHPQHQKRANVHWFSAGL